MYIDVSNVKEIIDQYDLVVDCTDNYETRFLLNDACYLYGKPLVYGAVFRFQGQISVFNYKSGVTYRCLQSSFPQENSIIDCNSDGVVGLVPGIVAMYQGIEVMKICLKREDVLDGEILLLDLLASKHYKMKIQKSNFDYASILVGNKLYTENYRFECHLSQDEITIDEIQLIQEEFILIDVREWGEEPEFEGENIVRCPISFVEQEVDFLKNDLKYIVLCQSGKRSVQWVKKNKKEGVWMKSLKGGIQKEENKLWIKLFTYEELF
jgi:adenylyltransferase/sulfurtransferase